jgi:hypothetical protein
MYTRPPYTVGLASNPGAGCPGSVGSGAANDHACLIDDAFAGVIAVEAFREVCRTENR